MKIALHECDSGEDYEEVSGQRYSGGLGHQTAPISHRSTAVCCVPELQTRVQEDFTIMEKIRYYLDTIKQQGDFNNIC